MSSSLDELVSLARERSGTRWLARNAHTYSSTGSTNALARSGVLRGDATGTIYAADHQTEGRGRLGRRWIADAGLNLTFSLLLRPASEHHGVIGIVAAIALRRAIASYSAPVRAWIKWPNDILLGDQKCCGMLLENVTQGPDPAIVLGIGINVNQASFSPVVAPAATSLLLATGRIVPRADLLAAALAKLEWALDTLDDGRIDPLLQEYHDHMYRRGQRVTFYRSADGQPVVGRILGIQADGALRLMTARGVEEFYAGDVTTGSLAERTG